MTTANTALCICCACKPGRHLNVRVIFEHVKEDRERGIVEEWQRILFPTMDEKMHKVGAKSFTAVKMIIAFVVILLYDYIKDHNIIKYHP